LSQGPEATLIAGLAIFLALTFAPCAYNALD
jgi:hypothetical protein